MWDNLDVEANGQIRLPNELNLALEKDYGDWSVYRDDDILPVLEHVDFETMRKYVEDDRYMLHSSMGVHDITGKEYNVGDDV